MEFAHYKCPIIIIIIIIIIIRCQLVDTKNRWP